MADVRSMLRQERASRQQAANPRPQPKSHSAAASGARAGSKRKALDDDHEDRKRPRADGLPADFFEGGAAPEVEDEDVDDGQEGPSLDSAADKQADSTAGNTLPTPTQTASTGASQQAPPPAAAPAPETVDEDEWAAFERDVAAEPVSVAPQSQSRPIDALAAISAAPSISAAPLSADELAVQAREQQSQQRTRREAELEAEREDAARHLEEEFDEMEQLEERVRKLREKREALRKAQEAESGDVPIVEAAVQEPAEQVNAEVDEDSDEDFDDWDNWR